MTSKYIESYSDFRVVITALENYKTLVQIARIMAQYSTKQVSTKLLTDIATALESIDSYGSVELYVQDSTVTQITIRNIMKTKKVTKNTPLHTVSN